MAWSDGMTRERMEAILAAYGASPARWPEAERAAAQAWAHANAAAFAAMAREAAALDAALDLDVGEAADDEALAVRILAARDGNVIPVRFGAPRPAGGWRRQAAALAACAVLGLAIGFAGAPRREDMAMDIDAAFGAAFDLPGYGDGAGG